MASSDNKGPDLVCLEDNPAPEGAEVIWYKGRKGRRLRLLYAPDPKGGVKTRGLALVCPGRTEFIEKYFETARDLQARGFAVAIFDWPGQGLSDRLHKEKLAGHVGGYSLYVDALLKGLQALGGRAREPYVIVAHSMGGAIALEALRTSLWQLVYRLDAGLGAAPQAWATRTLANDTGHRAGHMAQHVHGGIGVDLTYPIHRFMFWTRALGAALGGTEHHLAKLGDWLANNEHLGWKYDAAEDTPFEGNQHAAV